MIEGIQYVERNKLDVEKWNNCIRQADNELIYGYTWWLDHMADNWSALVWDDYAAVMPLPWRRKYGFWYLYQPAFTASLGLFKNEDMPVTFADFISAIPSRYRWWDINTNESNRLSAVNNAIKVQHRKNGFVDGSKHSYESIQQAYSRLAKRKLAIAEEAGIRINGHATADDVIGLYKKQYQQQHSTIRDKDYQSLHACMRIAMEKQNTTAYTSSLPDGKITAFYLVLHDEHFSYSLLGGSTDKGKETASFYLLTDAAIKDAAAHKRIFRFEGSDIPGIAFFNQQFGPSLVEYLHIQSNSLPFPVNMLKK
ncbi:MAG: GNAT family N-acetyltransferase [Agriterribacter sp.]